MTATAGEETARQGMRDVVINAALEVIQERGFARTRTSHIARAAGCAEGSIYRYFSGKSELMREVLQSRLREVIGVLTDLPLRAGTATVEANLLDAARAAGGRNRHETSSRRWTSVPVLVFPQCSLAVPAARRRS